MNTQQEKQVLLQTISEIEEFKNASKKTLELLAADAIRVRLKQGQTLLKPKKLESYGFILIKGALRLLGEDQ